VSPLLDLAGFYQFPFLVKAEVSTSIEVADEANAMAIQGRIDILVIQDSFWVLVIESKPARLNARLLHGFLAPVFFLPLLVSASTGIIFRLGKAWFGLSAEQAEFFMSIHQGSYLGKDLRALYVLTVGLGVLAMIATGIQMTGILRKRSVA
jgi:hypothetical protein